MGARTTKSFINKNINVSSDNTDKIKRGVMMKNKKGALQLSVNAVVVIIIAIVMLGLALTFMRNIFGTMIEQFGEVSQEVRKQMEDTLRATTKKAALSTNYLELKAGDKKTIYLGINNYLPDDVNFCIACPNCNRVSCGTGRTLTCTGYEVSEAECEDAIGISSPEEKKVLRSKIDVVPLKVNVKSNAAPDTYLIPIHIYGREPTSDATVEEVIDLYITVG